MIGRHDRDSGGWTAWIACGVMGYAFTMDEPSDDMATPCGFSNYQMNYVRLVMLWVSVIDGDGYKAHNWPEFPICDQTLPAGEFDGVGGRVNAAGAAFIAERLRQALETYAVEDLLDFFDDHPGGPEVRSWVEEFAGFNEQAAQRDGYHLV
jgi:hypothetical protein